MKSIFTLLLLLSSIFTHAQYIVKGKVTDQTREGIPGVRVFLSNTTYGVITNYKGEYFLELKEMGDHSVSFNMLGYSDTTIIVITQEKYTELNVEVKETARQLETVEIYADKVDIAKKVIKLTSQNKKKWRDHVNEYSCNTYIKTSLEKELKPVFVKADSIIGGKSKMNFIESYSTTKYHFPNSYHEEVLAHHDYAEKSSSSASATVNLDFGDNIVPVQYIEHNPYIFYEKVEDGNFNLYQNLINLPKISTKPIISPISDVGLVSYTYRLHSIFVEDGQKIYNIEVKPRNNQAPLFTGNLYIIDSIWVIKSFDLSINPACMAFFKDFRIIQDYEKIESNWVVVRREFNYSINDMKHNISANTRVNHSNYNFLVGFDKNHFGNEILTYNTDAFNKDSIYWDSLRPIQLKKAELSFIHEQDSITDYIESKAYLDSIDIEYNKLKFWDLTLSGIGYRNRYKKQEIYINSLLQSVKIFGVGGFRYGFGGRYSKEFNNAQKIAVDGEVDYGFNNKDIKGNLGIEYTFLPLKFGSFRIKAGDIYDMVNNYESVLGTFSRSNYVRKRFIGFSQRIELFNGLYLKGGVDISDRQEITNLTLSDWSNQLFGQLNEPQPFEQYTVSIFELNLVYRFKQKYVIKGDSKQIIGTQFPELKLTYKKGIPTLFGSDVNFDFFELAVSDKVQIRAFGELKWNFIAGSFVNKVDLKFIEHKFFRGSDDFLFSNPLKSHQLLDSTFHTPDPYFQAFAIHHFNGSIMNKIPLINLLKLQLVVGASVLFIKDINYSHIEFFGGIERAFKIKRQLLKIGIYSAARDNNISSGTLKLKIGMDFFNSYTNSWTY
jgi:hypothetical protein